MAPGVVLVTGGCGFVGFHVVKALRDDKIWPEVHVVSRNPSRNRQEEVTYHAGDVTSPEQIQKLLAEIQPSTIIHTASPVSAGNAANERTFMDVNLKGTQNLLKCAAASPHVSAFIYTSSSSVLAGSSFHNADENAPLITKTTRGVNYYSKSKALADQYVLDANGKCGVGTVCLRIASVYGERDNQMIPGTLAVLRQGHQKNQIGDNKNLFDVVSAENVAQAHLLAAKAMSSPSILPKSNIAGEAFLITEDDPLPFWDFERKIWAAAGDNTPLSDVRVIPAWFMLALASLVEWGYWIFTFGRKRPETLRRHNMEYASMERTYCIDKAKERLGYRPDASRRDEHIKRGVEWAMRKEAEAARDKQS